MGNQAVRSAKLAGRPSGFSQGCRDQSGADPLFPIILENTPPPVDDLDVISKSSSRDAMTKTAVALELRPNGDDFTAAK